MSVTVLTKENFIDEVMGAGVPVLIDFYADWCGPCKMLAPTIHALAESRADIKVCKVNVDEQMELATTFEVQVMPTLVAMKDGGVLGKRTGVMPESEILKLLGVEN